MFLIMSFILEFMARTRNPSFLDKRFKGFTIPSFLNFMGDDKNEVLVFPCRSHQEHTPLNQHFNTSFVPTG